MTHKIRWTTQKITQRINLVEPLIYRIRYPVAPFRYTTLPGPLEPPPVGLEVDDRDWPVIEPETYWGGWETNFTLRSHFQIPTGWDPDLPVALYLPIGIAGDFSHPEALAYIDGVSYAACDRYHQEILLASQWRDGQPHLLALHGWTGLGGRHEENPNTKLLMSRCEVVQIDPPTRDFIATARIALGIAMI